MYLLSLSIKLTKNVRMKSIPLVNKYFYIGSSTTSLLLLKIKYYGDGVPIKLYKYI